MKVTPMVLCDRSLKMYYVNDIIQVLPPFKFIISWKYDTVRLPLCVSTALSIYYELGLGLGLKTTIWVEKTDESCPPF
jgi:hypothetical protein